MAICASQTRPIPRQPVVGVFVVVGISNGGAAKQTAGRLKVGLVIYTNCRGANRGGTCLGYLRLWWLG